MIRKAKIEIEEEKEEISRNKINELVTMIEKQ